MMIEAGDEVGFAIGFGAAVSLIGVACREIPKRRRGRRLFLRNKKNM
jgi:hypothetical protein